MLLGRPSQDKHAAWIVCLCFTVQWQQISVVARLAQPFFHEFGASILQASKPIRQYQFPTPCRHVLDTATMDQEHVYTSTVTNAKTDKGKTAQGHRTCQEYEQQSICLALVPRSEGLKALPLIATSVTRNLSRVMFMQKMRKA